MRKHNQKNEHIKRQYLAYLREAKRQSEASLDALQYMAQHAADIIETNTTFGEESLPVPALASREGPARREGEATPKMFSDTFGFRGVEFGNWIGNAKTKEQSDRQNVLNHAFDALADMAEILGVPPRGLSLNGELALAFGARGHGLVGAKAHYESDYGVINLTKMKGAGSLAHEWLHALDHYLGRQDGKARQQIPGRQPGEPMFKPAGPNQDFASYGFRGNASGVREELREALAGVIRAMTSREKVESRDATKIEKFLGDVRKELPGRCLMARWCLDAPTCWWMTRSPEAARSLPWRITSQPRAATLSVPLP